MNISVIGAGYVGLVTAVGFASKGHNVLCIDRDKAKVDLIKQGKSPIFEDLMDDLLPRYMKSSGNLRASLDYEEILGTDMTFICVGTPAKSDDSINLKYIYKILQLGMEFT